MLIGPFNSFHVQEIIRVLQEKNIPHRVVQEAQAVEIMRERDKVEPPTMGQLGFKSRGSFLFLDMEEAHAKEMAPIFEKHGFVAQSEETHNELLENAEFHCLKCDYMSDHVGSCPSHNIALLEYSDWLKAQSAPGATPAWQNYLKVAALVIGLVCLYFFMGKKIR